MSEENKNVENKQEENKTGKIRLKVKIKNIFLIFLVITAVFFITAKASTEEEETLYTFKDSIQNFFINREKVNKPGKWVRLEGKLSTERRRVRAHLLPDGNVIIFGGTGLRFKENTVDIYSPKEDKVIKTVQICNDPYFRSSGYYNTISLKNGDVFLAYYIVTRKDNEKKNKTTSVAKIFDSKTYTFRDVTLKEAGAEQFLFVLLKDGNILMLSNSTRPNYIYNPNTDEYTEVENHEDGTPSPQIFQYENGDVLFYKTGKWYIFRDGKIEKYNIDLQRSGTQIDNEFLLDLNPKDDCTIGTLYNVKEQKKIPVINKMDKTWGANPHYPKEVQLVNKNILILGPYAKKMKIGERKKYTTYLYNYKENKFYKTENPPYYVSRDTATVTLKNGDILFIGGQLGRGMQIYKYEH